MRDDFFDEEERDEDEYAERVSTEVHRLIMPDGEFEVSEDGEILSETPPTHPNDSSEKSEEERQQEEAAAAEEKRRQSMLWGVLSGTILIKKSVSQAYVHLLCITLALFVNIVMVFWNLRLDTSHAKLTRQSQLLRERSFDFKTIRYRQTSHSAISKRLEERNIPLYTPQVAKTIIDN